MLNFASTMQESHARIARVPMIMIEGIDEKVNNRGLKEAYRHLHPTRCRVVFRSGRCLRKAGIEFSSEEAAREAVLFSQNLVIEGNKVRNARLATHADRDWFRKPAPKRKKKERPKVTKKKEILSQILYTGNDTPSSIDWIPVVQNPVTIHYSSDASSEWRTEDTIDIETNIGAVVPKIPSPLPNQYSPPNSRHENTKERDLILENGSPLDIESSFILIDVERLVNLSLTVTTNLSFPYELAMIKYTIPGLKKGQSSALFHRLIRNSNLPESLIASYLWCNDRARPKLFSEIGERDYSKLWLDLLDFIVEDGKPATLVAKGPHNVNVCLQDLFQKSGSATTIPFLPAVSIENFTETLLQSQGKGKQNTICENVFSQIPPEERLRALLNKSCEYHASQHSTHCAVLSCSLQFRICANVVMNNSI